MKITADQVRVGDKLTLTYEGKDYDYAVTGIARQTDVGLMIGGFAVEYPDHKIERHEPEWTSALVVRAGDRVFGRVSKDWGYCWHELGDFGTAGFDRDYIEHLALPLDRRPEILVPERID